MPVMSNLCTYADVDNSLLAETKTFNNMSPTEGFEYPYPQYMSAIFLLRTCYDLLVQAGFKDITKDEGEQSLTIWGLKLFFVNIAGNKNTINIAGPGINFLYKRNKQYHSSATELPSSNLGAPVVRYNHFLQHSLINAGNVYSREGAQFAADATKDYSGWECANSFYANTDDDGNIEYMLYVTLRCSNDGICFSTQIYNERQDVKGYQFPLFNIFKGKDILNDKDILILGKKIERVPFIFSTPYSNSKQALSSQSNLTKIYATSSSGANSELYHFYSDNSPNFNLFNSTVEFYTNHNSYGNNGVLYPQKANHAYITSSLDSALVCSGNNLIYYADDTYVQLEDTLYLDWNYNIQDGMILKGNAVANSGKYVVYGINQIVIDIPVQSNYYYDIEDEKYWCMFNHLITRYISFYNETNVDTLKSNMDTNYFNEIYSHIGFAQPLGYKYYSNGKSMGYGVSCVPSLDYLNSAYNSFGKMKKNFYEDNAGVNNAKKLACPVCLNPAILMRIDDTITE